MAGSGRSSPRRARAGTAALCILITSGSPFGLLYAGRRAVSHSRRPCPHKLSRKRRCCHVPARTPAHPAGAGIPRPCPAGGAAFMRHLLCRAYCPALLAAAGRRGLVHPAGTGAAAAGHRGARRPGPHLQCRRRVAGGQQQLLDPAGQPAGDACRQTGAGRPRSCADFGAGRSLPAGKVRDRASNDCLLRYRVERSMADAVRDFCEENSITGIRINQDSKRWYPQGSFLRRCWALPMWTTPE